MTKTTQEFIATVTLSARDELVKALLTLPEDKRAWSPAPTARTALDMVAECAMNNAFAIGLIETRRFPSRDANAYLSEKARLAAGDWDTLKKLLHDNTERLVAAIRAVPTNDLDITIDTPYGSGPLSAMCAYPYWNMSYHIGQIIYISTILGL